MKIVKYSEFNQELNESFWDDVKYGLSKLGRYKAGGKILGKKGTDDAAKLELREIMNKESNKLLKQVYGEVMIVAPEFPNDRKKITFLRGVLMYGQLYDSLVAAAKKDSKEEGYLAPDVCNQIIEDMRKVIKKFLDVDLKGIYTVTESKEDDITDEEILELYNFDDIDMSGINEEEEFFKKLVDLKNKAMDKMFGAKKGEDAEQKTTKGQSAKFQQTSGDKNVETERMKGLESNKLPLILAGVGAALGAIGWIAQSQWFKDLITTTVNHPAQFGEETFTKTIENNIKVDPKGWSYTIQNNGFMDATGKSLNFNQPVGNLQDAFKFYGGGDQAKGIEAMSNFLGGGGKASSVADITSQLADPSNKTIGDIFNHLEGTWGDKVLMNQNGGAKSFIAKQVYTQTKKVLIKAGFKTTTTSVIGTKLIALAPVLGTIGIALIGAGAVVKLLREKGQRQSRAKTLDNLLQSLVLVSVDVKKQGGEENVEKGGEDTIKKGEVPTEKTIYPLMIKNLKALNSMLISFDGVKAEGEGGDKKNQGLKIGNEYLYTNKKGEKKKVKLISLTHDTSIGNDKTWLTKDDAKKDTLASGKASVIFRDKEGKYTSKSPEIAVDSNQLAPLRESLLLEKEFGKGPRNVEVTKGEDYLTQSLGNIRKSIKSIKDEKDKGIGITTKFLTDILDKKMDSNSKEPIKNLYKEIYSYLYGDKSKTLSDFGPLYKESIEILSNKSKSQVVAEKIARLSKRSLQFEGENLYGGLGEFGQDMEEFNITLKQIMAYMKSKSEVKESRILSFKNYIKS
jgi:hypothetical protein